MVGRFERYGSTVSSSSKLAASHTADYSFFGKTFSLRSASRLVAPEAPAGTEVGIR